MNIKIQAVTNGEEVINEFILPQLATQNIKAIQDDIKVLVWSEKSQKFIDFKAKDIKFEFNR
jgi:hypothetical protein